MINYFNFQEWNAGYLITNDAGYYAFLTKDEFQDFILEKMNKTCSKYYELVQKYFIVDRHPFVTASNLADIIRNHRSYLQLSTSLFMFVMTNECNMHCRYCQAQSEKKRNYGKMNNQIAKRAADIALQSPCKEIMIEFQGGEPLLNFDTIKYVVDYLNRNKGEHEIKYSIVTNSSLLTPDIIDYLYGHEISVSLSIDGGKAVQDYNRPMNNGDSNYEYVLKHIQSLRDKGILAGAVMTTTRYSLDKAKEIVDTYCDLKLEDIFIRPLSPLGFAKEHWNEIGYTPAEFALFYSEALKYILEKNRKGYQLRESHANLFLQKILKQTSENYMELRSPCGAVIGQLAFYFNGNVYTCDEGRMLSQMGKEEFCLGNVYSSSFSDYIKSPICGAMCRASILETIPGCCDCVYMPYCGVCPATTYATENDIITRNYHNYRCATYKGIIDTLFKNLLIPENKQILESWING